MKVILSGAFSPLYSKTQCLTFNLKKNTKLAENMFTDNQEENNRKAVDVDIWLIG